MMKPYRLRAGLSMILALLLLCLPLSVTAETPPETQAVDLSLAQNAERFEIVGRAAATDAGITAYTTGSGIAFYARCSGDVTLTLTTKNNYKTQYFTVWVDGVRERVGIDNMVAVSRQKTVTLAENLDYGLHRIEIYRQTEEVNAECVFNTLSFTALSVDEDALFAVATSPLLIEFVGDSITAGYGIFAPENGQSPESPICQDGTQTYAYQTAQALGADFQACCTSGYGAVRGWNAGETNLQDMYPFTAYHRNHQDSEENYWSFARQADIVVINLGTNDGTAAKNKGLTNAAFQQGATALMELVREKNPDAKIVWVTGMMGTYYETELTDAIEALGGSDAGYFFCELPEGTDGGAGHPNLAQHTAAAQVLTAFLQENVLPDGYMESLVTAEEMRSLLEATASSSDITREVAATELAAFEANGGATAGTLTDAYNALLLWQQENGVPTYIWWIVGGCVVIVAALILFAVLYQPKKKHPIPCPTAPSEPAATADPSQPQP